MAKEATRMEEKFQMEGRKNASLPQNKFKALTKSKVVLKTKSKVESSLELAQPNDPAAGIATTNTIIPTRTSLHEFVQTKQTGDTVNIVSQF